MAELPSAPKMPVGAPAVQKVGSAKLFNGNGWLPNSAAVCVAQRKGPRTWRTRHGHAVLATVNSVASTTIGRGFVKTRKAHDEENARRGYMLRAFIPFPKPLRSLIM